MKNPSQLKEEYFQLEVNHCNSLTALTHVVRHYNGFIDNHGKYWHPEKFERHIYKMALARDKRHMTRAYGLRDITDKLLGKLLEEIS